jgi:hypothetical protein
LCSGEAPPAAPPARYHNARMINYDSRDGVGVQLSPEPGARRALRSTLTVSSVSSAGSGNYTCSPSTVGGPRPSRPGPPGHGVGAGEAAAGRAAGAGGEQGAGPPPAHRPPRARHRSLDTAPDRSCRINHQSCLTAEGNSVIKLRNTIYTNTQPMHNVLGQIKSPFSFLFEGAGSRFKIDQTKSASFIRKMQ